jgi:hypothetical protein
MKTLTLNSSSFSKHKAFCPTARSSVRSGVKQLGDELDMSYPSDLIRWEPEAEGLARVGEPTERHRVSNSVSASARSSLLGICHRSSDSRPSEVQEVDIDESQAVATPAKAGWGSFHHNLTLYGTAPNRSPYRRRAIICKYMPLDFIFTGTQNDRPPFHVVRGKHAGEIV